METGAQYPLLLLKIKPIKQFDDISEKVIIAKRHTIVEDLTKDEYRKLIIDDIVHLQM